MTSSVLPHRRRAFRFNIRSYLNFNARHFAYVALGAAALFVCAKASGAAEIAPPAAIADAGELVVCTDLTSVPANFLKPGSTEPTGYEADMTREIGRILGVKPAFRNMQFSGIIAALAAKKCDVIIASIGDTVKREETLDFVNYANVGTSIVVRPGNPFGFTDLNSLSGHSISTKLGTTLNDALDFVSKDLVAKGQKPIDIVTFRDSVGASAALVGGKVDAYFEETPAAAYLNTQQPGIFDLVRPQIFLTMVGQTNGLAAVAVRKEDTELKETMTSVVKTLYSSGKIQEIFTKWGVDSILLPKSFMDKCIVNCATVQVQ